MLLIVVFVSTECQLCFINVEFTGHGPAQEGDSVWQARRARPLGLLPTGLMVTLFV